MAASFFGAQSGSGGPRALPAPRKEAWGDTVGIYWKTLLNHMFPQFPQDDGRVHSRGARPLGGTTLGSGELHKNNHKQ